MLAELNWICKVCHWKRIQLILIRQEVLLTSSYWHTWSREWIQIPTCCDIVSDLYYFISFSHADYQADFLGRILNSENSENCVFILPIVDWYLSLRAHWTVPLFLSCQVYVQVSSPIAPGQFFATLKLTRKINSRQIYLFNKTKKCRAMCSPGKRLSLHPLSFLASH